MLAWLGAALERQKILPALSKVVGGDRARKDPQALKALITRLGRQRDG